MEVSGKLEDPASYPRKITPLPIGDCLRPAAGLDFLKKRKTLCPYRNSNPTSSDCIPFFFFNILWTVRHDTYMWEWPTRYTIVLINLFQLNCPLHVSRSTQWRSWLRHRDTSRKVVGSIPDGVTGVLQGYNPSGRTMALGSTQPLIVMSTRNISRG